MLPNQIFIFVYHTSSLVEFKLLEMLLKLVSYPFQVTLGFINVLLVVCEGCEQEDQRKIQSECNLKHTVLGASASEKPRMSQ